METAQTKNSMTLGILSRYLGDLIKMGFVSEHTDSDGNKYYKLTELGEKSGLKYEKQKLG
jgi:predicted transcriptional regulator